MLGLRTSDSGPLARKLDGFVSLPEQDQARLAEVDAGARVVASDTDLAREGSVPGDVILITDGFACRYKLRTEGQRQILAYLVPGDLCDLDGALLARMDHSIITLSPCRVARLSPGTIRELLQRPALARALRMSTLVDEATAREWLVNIGRRSALERLAHLFCELHARLSAVGLVTEDGFSLPITQTDLADTTGITPVHANRSLQELRHTGLISLRRGRLTILDLPRLRALAEFRMDYLHLGEPGTA